MKVLLDYNILKAALPCAAANDIRYYLNGVYIKATSNEVRYAATDGHLLFTAKKESGIDNWNVEIIIPTITVERAIESHEKVYGEKSGEINISLESIDEDRYILIGECRYILVDQVFKAIDGTYPDFLKIIPENCSGVLGKFNAKLLAKISKAVAMANKSDISDVTLNHNGDDASVIVGADPSVIGAIMPMKDSDYKIWKV